MAQVFKPIHAQLLITGVFLTRSTSLRLPRHDEPSTQSCAVAYHRRQGLLGHLPHLSDDWHNECTVLLPLLLSPPAEPC
jgi:hypothetical protein